MYYKFTRNGKPVLKGGTFDQAISIRFNNNTTPTSLKQLSAYTSHKTLRVYKKIQMATLLQPTASLKRRTLFTPRPLAVAPLHTRMPGLIIMPYTCRTLYILPPQAASNVINVNIYRNKLNKLYSPNVATITTLSTRSSTDPRNM